jgi:hypothetical protein
MQRNDERMNEESSPMTESSLLHLPNIDIVVDELRKA